MFKVIPMSFSGVKNAGLHNAAFIRCQTHPETLRLQSRNSVCQVQATRVEALHVKKGCV